MQLITTDIGQVKIGDLVLPGNFESLEIGAAVKLDQVEIAGKTDKATQAVGYENALLRLSIGLLPAEDDGDCIEQIRQIQQVFRKSNDQVKPGVYRIVNKHAQARGINEVIFSDLKTYEDNKSDKVLVTCEFTEYVSIKITVAQKGAGTGSGSSSGSSSSNKSLATRASVGIGDLRKAEATPAKDTRKTGIGAKILNWLRGKSNG